MFQKVFDQNNEIIHVCTERHDLCFDSRIRKFDLILKGTHGFGMKSKNKNFFFLSGFSFT